MTEARKHAATLAAEIETMANRLPEGTCTSVWSGWRSESAGMFSVGVRIHRLSNGTIVDFEVTGRTKHARYITKHDEYYQSLNWSEAECIHLCKTGHELIAGIDKLACEMMID